MAKKLRNNFAPIFLGTVLAILLTYFFDIQIVSGPSMNPTLNSGDYILVSLRASPRNQDIIILNTNEKTDQFPDLSDLIVKRYYSEKSTTGLYVIGDNTENSYDSRYVGEFSKDSCEGVVIFNFTKGINSIISKLKTITFFRPN